MTETREVAGSQPLRRRIWLLRRLVRKTSRWLWWGTLATAVASAVGNGAMAFGLKLLLDGAVAQQVAATVAGIALATVGLGLHMTTGRMYGNFKDWAGPQITAEMAAEVTRLVATIPTIEHLERPEYLDQVKLVQDSGTELANAVWAVLDTVVVVIRLAVTVVLLVTVHPLLVLVLPFSLPQLLLLGREHAHRESARVRSAEQARAADHLHALFADVDPGMEMRLFGAARELDRRADRLWLDVGRIQLHGELRAGAIAAIGWACSGLGFVAALVVTIVGVSRGWATTGDLLLVATLAASLRSHTMATSATLAQVRQAARTLDRAIWLHDVRDERSPHAGSVSNVPARLSQGIDLVDVSFTYPGTDMPVLTNLDLTLGAGTTVAVVGANGAGKTTLVKLLCGFYRPTSGRILVDGADLGSFDPTSWQHAITGAFQDHLNLETTLRDSVGFGSTAPRHDDEAVRQALADGAALSILEELPDGLDTLLGKTYHAGRELSGGQWQRLAVSRAMMRTEPLLLVLDEPTAALDPSAEHALYERYANAAARSSQLGGVTLLVSHRFSSVRMADVIVVLEHGRIVERGSHDDLMAVGGIYRQMFDQQANAYRS